METRLSDSAVIKDQSYAYNNRNQLTGITDNLDAANNVTYSYDDNGNQTRKVKGTETTDFIYNARDELRQVQVGGSTVGQFLYDYQGMRVQKTGDRGVEQYHYDGKSVLAQYDETDQLIAHFQYGPNRLLSLQEPGGDAEYYLFDSLGSPVNLTTGAGAVTARYQYDAWGNKRSETGTSFNRFGFTGHEEDSETGLIYAKARYYDPDTGRFLNQDPFDGMIDTPPSLHKYLYAYGNPTSYVDPDGEIVWFAVIAYVAYSGATAAVDTAIEAGIDAGVSAATGQESEFNAGESFAINFGINLVSGGTGGKAKNTYKAVEAADKILDARQAVKAAETVQDARQANVVAKAKSETKLTKENSSGMDHVSSSKQERREYLNEKFDRKDSIHENVNAGNGYRTEKNLDKDGYYSPRRSSTPRAEGGQHKHTAKDGNRGTEDATESHHLIADSISDIKTSDAPAVRMKTKDHSKTGSHGSQGAQGERWRQKQKELVDQGKYDEALDMGIEDLRATSGNLYDEHLDEMFDNLPKRSNDKVDWGLLRRKE